MLEELPVIRGWAYLAAAIEDDGWLQFAGIKRDGKGYLAQEISKLKSEAYETLGLSEPAIAPKQDSCQDSPHGSRE